MNSTVCWSVNGLFDALLAIALLRARGPYSVRRARRKDIVVAFYSAGMALLCFNCWKLNEPSLSQVAQQMIFLERGGFAALLAHDLLLRPQDVNKFETGLFFVNVLLLAQLVVSVMIG